MEFHPKDLPISKTYDLKDEKEAIKAVEDMVKLGFQAKKESYCRCCGRTWGGVRYCNA